MVSPSLLVIRSKKLPDKWLGRSNSSFSEVAMVTPFRFINSKRETSIPSTLMYSDAGFGATEHSAWLISDVLVVDFFWIVTVTLFANIFSSPLFFK